MINLQSLEIRHLWADLYRAINLFFDVLNINVVSLLTMRQMSIRRITVCMNERGGWLA